MLDISTVWKSSVFLFHSVVFVSAEVQMIFTGILNSSSSGAVNKQTIAPFASTRENGATSATIITIDILAVAYKNYCAIIIINILAVAYKNYCRTIMLW